MKPHVLRRPRAQEDILEHAYYIAERSLDASDRFLRAVETTLQQIAEMPGLGRVRDWDNPALAGVRQWAVSGFEKYLIF